MQCQGQANFIPLFAKISTWLQAHWRMFVSFSDIELEFVLSSMLIPKRFSFFFQLTIMLNLGNWSFFVRFFSLVGIASMLQHNFLVTLLFSPNFASHVWAIKSVDFRLAQLGACWFFPLQCFPPGWASPARFSLPDYSLCCSRFCQILCKSESKFMDANQFNRLPSYFLLNYKQPAKWSLWYVLWMSDYKIKKMYFVHWTSPELRG